MLRVADRHSRVPDHSEPSAAQPNDGHPTTCNVVSPTSSSLPPSARSFSLLLMIFDRPVHWSKATNLGSNITPCVSTVDTGFDVVVLDAGCQIEAYHLRDLVSFKPGSADAIRQVRSIAAAYPDDFPIILQWTGGRTGGHHSAEDFHQPILATYSRIRRNTNISLVTGIGFRSADDLWP
ncbi:unnamed protein product [Tilletia caries]|uniref:Fatty acid synthase beta subunit AflB /Fas1-like central domain-containing protein n=1 Tax=Tilletia caries TaxID=13290 RepID=A0ABN7J5G2_9BASI|nr:unnamed protein product [Tilletia caries]